MPDILARLKKWWNAKLELRRKIGEHKATIKQLEAKVRLLVQEHKFEIEASMSTKVRVFVKNADKSGKTWLQLSEESAKIKKHVEELDKYLETRKPVHDRGDKSRFVIDKTAKAGSRGLYGSHL